jgi:hypothetical protein
MALKREPENQHDATPAIFNRRPFMSQTPRNRLRFAPDDDSLRRQAKNKKLVLRTASACGFQLSRFITNEHMELYYDIAQNNRELGYISKGWEDPGFRVGNVLPVPVGAIEAVKVHSDRLTNYCATRGVAMTGHWKDEDKFEFHLDSVIYSAGFNQKVFTQVLEYLTDCVEKWRTSLAVK